MFRSYTDMQWRRVDLNQLDFSVGTSIISIGLPKGINALNVTRAPLSPFDVFSDARLDTRAALGAHAGAGGACAGRVHSTKLNKHKQIQL